MGTGKLNDPGFAGYAPTNLTNASVTDNVRLTANTTMAANTTVNTLNLNYAGGGLTVDLGGNTLTVRGGGIINASSADTTTGSINNGSLTSGQLNVGGDLYYYHLPYAGANRFAAIGANVVDNGTGPVRLIISNSEVSGSNRAVTLNGTNTNTGASWRTSAP